MLGIRDFHGWLRRSLTTFVITVWRARERERERERDRDRDRDRERDETKSTTRVFSTFLGRC